MVIVDGFYYPPFAFADPLALIQFWMYMWLYWLYAMYYVEMMKASMETWRRLMEYIVKIPSSAA